VAACLFTKPPCGGRPQAAPTQVHAKIDFPVLPPGALDNRQERGMIKNRIEEIGKEFCPVRKIRKQFLALLLALAVAASLAAPAFAFEFIDGKLYDDEGNCLGEAIPKPPADSTTPPSATGSLPPGGRDPDEDSGSTTTLTSNARLDVTALTDSQREAFRNATRFSDVSADDWYAEAVNAMASTGLLAGYEDGTFQPNKNITVGEWCTILMRIATFEDADLSGGTKSPHWAGGTVFQALGLRYTRTGMTKDENATHWQEDELVNRGEAITGLTHLIQSSRNDNDAYAELYERLTSSKKSAPGYRVRVWEDIPDHAVILANNETYSPYAPGYLEVDSILWNNVSHSWDPNRILSAYNEGLVSGVDDAGTCAPMANLTRAEACQMLYTAGLTWCMDNLPHVSGMGDFTPKS